MAKFKCNNDSCSLKDKEIIVSKIRWVWNKSINKLVPAELILCKECGQELVNIPNDTIPNLCFNEFDSLSPEQKRAAIKKRSSDHFNKTDKGDLGRHKQRIMDDNKRMVMGGQK